MKNEFVDYQTALALKELGFDEPCFAHLIGFGDGTIENGKYVINYQQVFYPNDFIKSDDKAEELGLHPFSICGVPLYQQAFRWFREKYGLRIRNYVFVNFSGDISEGFEIFKYSKDTIDRVEALTYEEAELECLKKLIQLAK